MTRSFAVDGRRFRLSLAQAPNSLSVSCDPEEGASPLGSAVVTAWMRDPRALLRSIDARTGMSFEGETGFDYDPDPSRVTAFARDAEETVAADFFARFVVTFGLTFLDAAGRLGLDLGEDMREDLSARR
ncbi:MAG: hypothetical protein ACHQ2Z_01370 [Elusimicrobiota bacterium]